MHEATIRIRDETTYASATADSDATVELWCNDHCDLLHVFGPAADVVEHVRDEVGIRDDIQQGDERLVVTRECLKRHEEGYVERYVKRHGCLLLPPLKYEDGMKVVRVLALDGEQLTAFYRDLVDDVEVEVAEKRTVSMPLSDSPLLRLDVLLPRLSTRQREVLVAAWREGYYRIPREVTTTELAAAFDLERRTVEEHLRLAEGKLMDAIVEHVA